MGRAQLLVALLPSKPIVNASIAHHLLVPIAIESRLRSGFAVEEAVDALMKPHHYNGSTTRDPLAGVASIKSPSW